MTSFPGFLTSAITARQMRRTVTLSTDQCIEFDWYRDSMGRGSHWKEIGGTKLLTAGGGELALRPRDVAPSLDGMSCKEGPVCLRDDLTPNSFGTLPQIALPLALGALRPRLRLYKPAVFDWD